MSLPLNMFVAEVKENGVRHYEKRTVTVFTVAAFVAVFAIYLFAGGYATLFSGLNKTIANENTWDFNEVTFYNYDSSKIQIVDGVVLFKSQILEEEVDLEDETEETETEIETDSKEEVDVEDGTEENEADTDSEIKSDSEEEIDTEDGVEETETKTDTEIDSETEANDEVETDTDTETESTPETETDPEEATEEAEAEPEAETELSVINQILNIKTANAESDENLEKEINVETCTASLEPLKSFKPEKLTAWEDFTEVADKGDGEIYYQFSVDDGESWLHYSELNKVWEEAKTSEQAHTAKELSEYFSDLPVTTSSLKFKAIFTNNCDSDIKLLSLRVDYSEEAKTKAELNEKPKKQKDDSVSADTVKLPTKTAEVVDLDDDEVLVLIEDEKSIILELDDELDLSGAKIGNDKGKVWLHLGETERESIKGIELLIPRNSLDEFVYICPGAETAESIYLGCPNEIRLTPKQPKSDNYGLVELDDPDFWHVKATSVDKFSTGGSGGSMSPILEWDLDDNAGCTATDGSDDNDGALGPNCPASAPSWEAGLSNSALDFSGNGENIQDADAEDYLDDLTEISLVAWVRSNSINVDKGIFNGQTPNGADTPLSLRYDAAGSDAGCTECIKAGLKVDDSTIYLESSSSKQTTDWQFLALTWKSGEQLKLYINGQLDTPSSNSAAASGSIADIETLILGQGSKDIGALGWDGLIDEVKIYDRQISSGEITTLYSSLVPKYIRVQSPNGGETLTVGETTDITWDESDTSDNVKIEYSTDDFVTDVNTIVETTANDGSYTWTIPSVVSSSLKIKITDLEETIINDNSDANFSISLIPAATAKWSFNENAGETTTESVAATTETISGTANWVTGIDGSALSFDGSNDYVALNYNLTDSGQLPAVSACAWFKVAPGGGGWSLIDLDRSEYFNLDIGYTGRSTNVINFATRANSGGVHDMAGTINVRDNQWHHACGVYDGTNKYIYVDGVLDRQVDNPHSGRPIGTGRDRYGFIGDGSEAGSYNANRNGFYFDGTIDEVSVYEKGLSAAAVSALYNQVQSLTLETPNGGDSLFMGTLTTISWLELNAAANVSIEYSKDNFVNDINVIEASTANDGSYSWLVPFDPSETVKVRIKELGGSLEAVSAANFSIGSQVSSDGYWPLDEAAGTTTVNSVTNDQDELKGDPTWVTGVSGSALDLDGSGDYVALNSNFTNSGELATFTACAWFKVAPGGGGWSLLDFDRSEYFNLEIGWTSRNSNFVNFATKGAGGSIHDMSGTTNVRDNQWHFTCGVYDGVNKYIYVDGAIDRQVNNPHSGRSIGSGATRYGFIGDGSEATSFNGSRNNVYFRGAIDEVRYWQRSLSVSEINAMYLQALNTIPSLTIDQINQTDGDGNVEIDFTVADADSNFISLIKYEYSLTGAFAGEEETLTLATDDPDHDGILSLASSVGGESYTLVWNADADLTDIYSETVYIRLLPTDGIELGSSVVSPVTTVDTKLPVVSNLTATQTLNSNSVTVAYDLSDDNSSQLTTSLEISADAGVTWDVPVTSAAGDLGTEQTTGLGKLITWDAGLDYPDQDRDDLLVRVIATDRFGNQQVLTNTNLSLDTKDPFGLGSPNLVSASDSQLEFSWAQVAVETNFSSYVIYYGTEQAAVTNKTSSSANSITNPDLADQNTNTLIISDLISEQEYFILITAIDDYGNEVSLNLLAATTLAPEQTGQGGGDSSSFREITPTINTETESTDSAQTNSESESTAEFLNLTNPDPVNEQPTEPTQPAANTEILAENTVPDQIDAELKLTPNLVELPAGESDQIYVEDETLKIVEQTRESTLLAKPELKVIEQSFGQNQVAFKGQGIPNSDVVIFIHSEQAVVYSERVDSNGNWEFIHSQADLELAEGPHIAYAVAADPNSAIRSQPSEAIGFNIKTNRLAKVLGHFDLGSSFWTLIILAVSLMLLLGIEQKVKNTLSN